MIDDGKSELTDSSEDEPRTYGRRREGPSNMIGGGSGVTIVCSRQAKRGEDGACECVRRIARSVPCSRCRGRAGPSNTIGWGRGETEREDEAATVDIGLSARVAGESEAARERSLLDSPSRAGASKMSNIWKSMTGESSSWRDIAEAVAIGRRVECGRGALRETAC